MATIWKNVAGNDTIAFDQKVLDLLLGGKTKLLHVSTERTGQCTGSRALIAHSVGTICPRWRRWSMPGWSRTTHAFATCARAFAASISCSVLSMRRRENWRSELSRRPRRPVLCPGFLTMNSLKIVHFLKTVPRIHAFRRRLRPCIKKPGIYQSIGISCC